MIRAPLTPDVAIRVDEAEPAAWDALVERFDDATVYQTWGYEAVRWGERRMSHLVLERDGRAVAAAQVRVLRVPGCNCGIAYVYRGPLWRPRGAIADTGMFSEVLHALYREYAVARGLLLRVMPNEPEERTEELAASLKYQGYTRASATPYRTFVLDLSPELEALRKGLRHQWRTNLNKAVARSFRVDEGVTDKLYGEFVELYNEMHARKGFRRYVDVEEFRRIQQGLPDSLKMRVMVCRLEGEAVAGVVFSTLGSTALNVFLATSARALEVQGAYRLLWEEIRWLRERGVRLLDLGGVDPVANPGGYRFKQGLSGREVRHLGVYEACENGTSWLCVRAAEKLRDAYRALRMP
jgi:lipid II:glycine glycyltransferase (peptidoglycan interpeptide bridge formation enzyme)